MTTKKDIFKSHLKEWLNIQGDRKKRGEMGKEISQVAQVNIKSVSRSFRRAQFASSTKEEIRGRSIYYTKDVDAALYDIWEAAYEPCGELLHPLIAEYISGFKQANRWKHSAEATAKLLAMSLGTMKRHAKYLRKKYGVNHGRSTTQPSNLKHIIPIFKGPWNNLKPGNGQIDTVAHCSDSIAGDFVYTVSFVDAATYWGVRRAQWNKGQIATKNNLIVIKERLPFPWLMAHPDTGSEFINWIAKEWCDQNGVRLTRSEPGKKNDNMYVEERNGHVVRKFLGYQRFDVGPEIVILMNNYYEVLDLYLNHFQTVRRTLSKERVGSRYQRKFEAIAQTPYQRFMENQSILIESKECMRKIHESLNPLLLKEKLDILRTRTFNYQRNHNQTTKY